MMHTEVCIWKYELTTLQAKAIGLKEKVTMKILVVDSDRDLVEMLMSWLKTRGYEVYRAYTGEQAKAQWIEQRPDLVILDTALEDVDALAMYRDMRTKHDALLLIATEGKDV